MSLTGDKTPARSGGGEHVTPYLAPTGAGDQTYQGHEVVATDREAGVHPTQT